MGNPTLHFGRPFTMEEFFRGLQDIGDYELMQFTGLKDKDEKEIYEGDIYKVKYGQGEAIFRVKYNHGAFCLVNKKVKQSDRYLGNKIHKDNGEVIGNVYENPELLK